MNEAQEPWAAHALVEALVRRGVDDDGINAAVDELEARLTAAPQVAGALRPQRQPILHVGRSQRKQHGRQS
jgi:hypothetical protein